MEQIESPTVGTFVETIDEIVDQYRTLPHGHARRDFREKKLLWISEECMKRGVYPVSVLAYYDRQCNDIDYAQGWMKV